MRVVRCPEFTTLRLSAGNEGIVLLLVVAIACMRCALYNVATPLHRSPATPCFNLRTFFARPFSCSDLSPRFRAWIPLLPGAPATPITRYISRTTKNERRRSVNGTLKYNWFMRARFVYILTCLYVYVYTLFQFSDSSLLHKLHAR